MALTRPTRALVFLALAACAGCGKPAEISDARRDHLLAGPHGWIDLVVQAPPRTPDDAGLNLRCVIGFAVNDESMMTEQANPFEADAAHASLGYRLVVPAGALKTSLELTGCVKAPILVALPLALEKDHLASIAFDGHALVVNKVAPYLPTTLDALREELVRLHDDARDDAAQAKENLRTLTAVAAASLALNAVLAVALAIVGWRRRRAPA